ncbi:hypothetical protein N7508_010121 [Penicillium antarcticum]|uniref:uncharacterized protein n=1 Tax=Penicillium antarcticum TaxID=416450 RepID=UPI00239C1CB0|nr:uncharacterized protein N7508_010121 [Penicillium antarcticum]KAJ5295300.1 hypothetical protein N7508_010121 [Penicillium antarcticum]
MYALRTASLLLPQLLSVLATPASVSPLQPRDLISSLSNTIKSIGYLGQGITQDLALLVSTLDDVENGKIDPVTTIEEALGSLGNVRNASEVGLIGVAIDVVKNGLAPKNVLDLVQGLTASSLNSMENENLREPESTIFPKKASSDAPYDISEEKLRSSIYIPEEFQYGANGKRPVLLVPGTANPAGTTYYFNYEKLFNQSNFADSVWLNIPDNTLGDIQVTAEYIAYAINYISGITGNTKIGVLAWSQGSIDVQWALKYWPSTWDSVSDFLSISGEFHGSLSEELCLVPNTLCKPALRQQSYDSNLITTLRAGDGDSAYVPTTSVYSGIDELVAPQVGPEASARLKDVRGVGVTNTQIQLACPGKPAGTLYTHDPLLFNSLVYALFADALTHDGPADLSRVDLDTVCNQLIAPGLVLTDMLGSEVEAYVYNAIDSSTYKGSASSEEPPIKEYARISS